MIMRVLSYNIREGAEGRLVAVTDVIRQEQPNAVALLEAASRDNAETLARELDMQLVFGEANNEQGHIAWLSRHPITSSANYRDARLAKTLLGIEMDLDAGSVMLFAAHLGSRWDRPQPVDEVPVILDLLQLAAGRPHALVGDFNALRPDDPVGQPPGAEQKRGDAVDGAPRRAIQMIVDAGYVDCYRQLHPQAPGYTYPSHHPWLRLDYIFASPHLAQRLLACDIVEQTTTITASDHLPVSADFRLG